MRRSYRQRREGVAAALVLSALCVCCYPFGFELHQELSSASGGKIQVALVGHDDPGVLVRELAFDKRGRKLPTYELLGTTSDCELPGVQFALHEAQGGNLVGLYQLTRPDVLLMGANFDERWTLSKGDRYEYPERAAAALSQLSKEAGRPLALAENLVHDWEQ